MRRVVQALERGHHPAEVMRLSEPGLEALLATVEGVPDALVSPRSTAVTVARVPPRLRDLLAATRAYDGAALRTGLEMAARRRSPLDFIEEVAVPLMRAVGRSWASGRLDVRHEHFASARMADILHAMRRDREGQERGPRVAMALLPGDAHELGLLMASVVFADARWRVLYLGAETPPGQIVSIARDASLEAVAIGVSSSAPAEPTLESLRSIRRDLPRAVALLVGGAGASGDVRGAEICRDLRALERWLTSRPQCPRVVAPPRGNRRQASSR
jgi:methanogenic corrinoid protein MtbC1